MKRILSAVLSAALLAGVIGAGSIVVQAKETTQVPKSLVIEDFEGQTPSLKEDGMDLLPITLEKSSKYKNSGTSSMVISHSGALGGDPISEMKMTFSSKNASGEEQNNIDLSDVQYMDIWVKNDSDQVVGLTWIRLDYEKCCYASQIQDAQGAWQKNLTFVAETAGKYTDANGTVWKKVWDNNPVTAIPANYTGWLRLELSGNGKKANTEFMQLGFLPSDDGAHNLYLDDVTLVYATKTSQYVAPTGATGVAPSKDGAADGKITGVTNEMEYRTAAETTYTAVTGTEITGLAAGTYYVRYKADGDVIASADAAVTVPGYVAPPEDDHLRMVNNFNTAEKVAQAQGKEYPFLAGDTFEVGKMPGKDSNCLQATFHEDTNNPLQKILVTTNTGDLTNADFIQIQVKWDSDSVVYIKPANADATLGNAIWYYRKADENPGWEDTDDGKFWKDWILIKGHADSVVGVGCTSVELYVDGAWKSAKLGDAAFNGYEIPAGYQGYIRFALPAGAKKADRLGVVFEFKNGASGFAGTLYMDDLMVGMNEKADEAYPYAFKTYLENTVELKDATAPTEPTKATDPTGTTQTQPDDNTNTDTTTTLEKTDTPETGSGSVAGLIGLGLLAAVSICAVSIRKK